MNRVVQGLWIGEELSAMERLSITSFLAHGHDFDLYTYGPVRGVPEGARVLDAGEVLPAARVFRYTDHPSYAGFANFFRYRLLLERGGWWVDMDSVCLGAFDFEEELVFSSEPGPGGRDVPTPGFIKAPAGSAVMRELWRICESKDPRRIRWGETGPGLVAQVLGRLGLEGAVRESPVFCPVRYSEWERVLDPAESWTFPPGTRAIHLWNEMWRRAGRDKDDRYPPACLYERLKARHGIVATSAHDDPAI